VLIIDFSSESSLGILCVSAQPRDQDHVQLVADLDLDSVIVSLNVKDHSVVAQEAGTGVTSLNVSGATPFRSFHLANPGLQRGTDVGVPTYEVIKLGLSE
jgi:hypothetical protein